MGFVRIQGDSIFFGDHNECLISEAPELADALGPITVVGSLATECILPATEQI